MREGPDLGARGTGRREAPRPGALLRERREQWGRERRREAGAFYSGCRLGGAFLKKVLSFARVPEFKYLKMSELGLLEEQRILTAAAPERPKNPPRDPVGVRDAAERLTVAREELLAGDDAPERARHRAWKDQRK